MLFPDIARKVAVALFEAVGDRTSADDVIPVLARHQPLLAEASKALGATSDIEPIGQAPLSKRRERAFELWMEMLDNLNRDNVHGMRCAIAHYLPRINSLLAAA